MNMSAMVRVFLGVSMVALLLPTPLLAAKKRVRTVSTRTVSSGYSTAKLSRATNSVKVTFINLTQAADIEYVLSYTASGIAQGAVGTVRPTGQSTDTRDLYFGTCSHGVCTPHYAIKNATLTITTTLKSGAKNIKRYLIRL